MNAYSFLLYLLAILKFTNGYRILGLVPFHGRSHFIMLEPLFKELAARGHEVDVFGHYPQKEKIPRYNDYSIAGTLPIILGTFKFDTMSDMNYFSFYYMAFKKYGLDICENAFNTTAARKLLKNKYDLIITEIFFNDCMYGFAHYFQVPVVAVSTSTDMPWGARRIGNPSLPSFIPMFLLPYKDAMDLMERIWNTVYYVFSVASYDLYATHYGNKMMQNFFGYKMPHLDHLIYNHTNLVLINTHFSMNYVSPKLPNFIEVAGLHILPPKPLPEKIKRELEVDIETKYDGVVYVSFGSLMAVETFPWNALNSFCQAFAELKYKILWKANFEKLPKNLTIPSNVHFEKWMPQRDILCHPNTKVFVSHGGSMGTQEAIYCGVPILGLPVFFDQSLNLENCKARGFALKLEYKDVTKDVFHNYLLDLLKNPKYQINAKKISNMFRDRPQTALETAVYWTEYVLKYEGAKHLKSAARDLPFYQYFLLDVIAILGLLLFFANFAIYFLLRFIYRSFVIKSKTKQKES